MKITNSLEWSGFREELNLSINKLPYDPSLRQMLKNIDSMVNDLSKLEVEARRTKNSQYTDKSLKTVNESITTLQKLIMIGILLS